VASLDTVAESFAARFARVRAPALFLAPGIGAQGATSADVARTSATCPDRVMPSASRSLLAAGPGTGALRAAAAALAAEFRTALAIPGG